MRKNFLLLCLCLLAFVSNAQTGYRTTVKFEPGAFYKVSVDLKDGLTIDEEGRAVPVGAKFTFSFTPFVK